MNKEELSKIINEHLFESEDKVDFSRMKKTDLVVLKETLKSDQAVFIAARLARGAGVGQGKIVNILLGESPLKGLLGSKGEGET